MIIGRLKPDAANHEEEGYLERVGSDEFQILGQMKIYPEHRSKNNPARKNNYLIVVPEHTRAIRAMNLSWADEVERNDQGHFESYIDVNLQEYRKNPISDKPIHLWIVSDAIEILSGFNNKYNSKKLDVI